MSKLTKKIRSTLFGWRYIYNFKSSLNYLLSNKGINSSEMKRVLEEYNKNGIAITHIDDLMPHNSIYKEMATEVDKIENERAQEIELARVDSKREKDFIITLLAEKPELDTESIFTRFILQKPFVYLANAYSGLFTEMRYYNVWHTLKTDQPPKQSQLWHRDREDFLIVKIFVYLNDVDETAGPFTYAKGSHRKKSLVKDPEYLVESDGTHRTTDDQMNAVIPRKDWVTATGRKGTIIFADTAGYHKGGHATGHDRLMFIARFTSRKGAKTKFTNKIIAKEPTEQAIKYALGI